MTILHWYRFCLCVSIISKFSASMNAFRKSGSANFTFQELLHNSEFLMTSILSHFLQIIETLNNYLNQIMIVISKTVSPHHYLHVSPQKTQFFQQFSVGMGQLTWEAFEFCSWPIWIQGHCEALGLWAKYYVVFFGFDDQRWEAWLLWNVSLGFHNKLFYFDNYSKASSISLWIKDSTQPWYYFEGQLK